MPGLRWRRLSSPTARRSPTTPCPCPAAAAAMLLAGPAKGRPQATQRPQAASTVGFGKHPRLRIQPTLPRRLRGIGTVARPNLALVTITASRGIRALVRAVACFATWPKYPATFRRCLSWYHRPSSRPASPQSRLSALLPSVSGSSARLAPNFNFQDCLREHSPTGWPDRGANVHSLSRSRGSDALTARARPGGHRAAWPCSPATLCSSSLLATRGMGRGGAMSTSHCQSRIDDPGSFPLTSAGGIWELIRGRPL